MIFNEQGIGSLSNKLAKNSAANGAEHSPLDPNPANIYNLEFSAGNQPVAVMWVRVSANVF